LGQGRRRTAGEEPESAAVDRSGAPVNVPSLLDVYKDPTVLKGLPLRVIVTLRRQSSQLAADLDAAVVTTLANSITQDRWPAADADKLLTPEEAAARFGVSRRWLLDHADTMPGVKRLSRKVIRFSERRLARFLDRGLI
jgi:hypothetical protein